MARHSSPFKKSGSYKSSALKINKSKITMVAFQQQSPQRLVDEYEHINSRNDRLDLRLNPLQGKYYFIK